MRRKRIVAMALALSVFASTFGTLGAAAEDAGALPVDAEKSPFTVVAVALDGSENQSPTPPPQSVINDTSEGTEETKDKVLDEDQDKDQDENQDKDQDKALNETKDEVLDETESKNENQGTEAPGETEGTDETDGSDGEGQEPSISDIQRPEQSETVETLPGNQEDLKKEPAEDDKYPESKDYEFVYDPETKHFHVTFHIQEDAEGDQTIELSKVLEEVDGYGQAEFDNWKNTPGYQAALDRGQTKINWTGDRFNDVEYVFDLKTGKASLYTEPGCTTIFDVSLTNGSKHTYVYQDGSLTVATAKLPKNDDPNASVGFDGQPLPDVIAGTNVAITYNRGTGVHGCMEDLIDQLGLDRQWDSPSKVHRAVDKYIKDNYNGDYDAYILDYYNKKDGTSYTSVNDLLANNDAALIDLNKSGTGEELHSITFDSPTYYNHFYKNVLSLKVDDSDKLEEFKKDAGVSWSSNGNELTIGDYMYDKLNSTEGAWDKANSYFNALLSSGLGEDEATWAAFALAVNLDGELANNNMQKKPLSWYASMVLKQADGTLDLTKYDQDGNPIGASGKPEDQTSFYLWKYETDKTSGEKSTLYYTKVPDKLDEEGNVVTAGYNGWVKYDPDNKTLSYTITTTNGKLNIDYALLENMVYYLQEAVAPKGYDIDTTVYVICDEEAYNELKDSGETIDNVAAGTSTSAADLGYLGAMKGGETLTVKFVNRKTVTPEPIPEPTPDPTPDPTPVEPENPETPPVEPETPETPVAPETPQEPTVQEAVPAGDVLPQTGTSAWMVQLLLTAGFVLLAAGWFFSRKQYAPKH